MLLPSKDGIACDFCASRYKEKFIYYSLKAIEYQVRGRQKMPGKDAKFAKDMCMTCYDSLVEETLEFIGSYKPGFVKDDLSKDYGSGNFIYWFIVFDRVEVDKSQPEDSQVEVEKHVLDLNLVHYEKFKKRTEKARENIEKTGAWS